MTLRRVNFLKSVPLRRTHFLKLVPLRVLNVEISIPWILETGFWNNAGTWQNDKTWNI